MTYMTKEQLRQHLLNAPSGTTPGGIVSALRSQGVQMEGDPTPIVTQTPGATATPTDKPLGGVSTTVEDPQKGVLGTSTLAKTGTFEQSIMNLLGVMGMLLLGAGFKSYKKELAA